MKINFDARIEKFLNICKENNIELYLVGGYIRDSILNVSSSDLDFALTSDYKKALLILKKYYKCVYYDRYQSIKIDIDEYKIEISHSRKEEDYLDYRHPSKIVFIEDIKEDSKRRDFTINALYYKDGVLYDFYNSYNDIKNKRLNFIGDTLTRCKEDALRILRMIRFQSNGYQVSNEDKKIILDNKELVTHLNLNSFESEFDKILMIGNINIIDEYKEVFECYYKIKINSLLDLNKFNSLKDKKMYLNIGGEGK